MRVGSAFGIFDLVVSDVWFMAVCGCCWLVGRDFQQFVCRYVTPRARI